MKHRSEKKEGAVIVSKKKQFITDDSGKRVGVILDISTYRNMLDELDDYCCRKAYDRSKKETDREVKEGQYVTIEDYAAKRAKRTAKAP